VSQLLSKVSNCRILQVLHQMFQLMSALLLDDALKPATSLTNVFDCCFEDTDISQDSVATHLRCGGIFIVTVGLVYYY